MASLVERQRYIRIAFFVAAAALIGKAAQLQIFDRSYSTRADATTIDRMTVYPSRGLVYDRNGKLIVNNNAMYDLMATYNQVDSTMRRPTGDIAKIRAFCALLGINEAEYFLNLNKDWRGGRFSRNVPFVFQKKIPVESYAKLQEQLYKYPGFFVQVRNIRGYAYNVGAHLLGYINEVDQRDIDNGNGVYTSGDYIGAAGIESEYEDYLRGQKGVSMQLKDNLGRIVGQLDDGAQDIPAVSGSDMVTGIDIELQEYGEWLMQNKTGSIVAIEPKTGEILAMISAPTYDPNLLMMTQTRGEVFSRLLTDPLKPFFDRTVMAKYPPGSIFKTVVSLVGLQEGTLNPKSGISCNGGYFYAGRLYKCHHHAGVNNAVDALAYSCNTYFFTELRNIVDKFGYANGQQGLDMFNKYCHEMGLGEELGIDYPNESGGFIPNSAYYDRIYPRKLGGWHSPTIMSIGIGQGEIQLTTLQMANLAALIANGGYWYRPHLAKEFKDKTPIPERFHEKQTVHINPEYFAIVREGMAQCVVRGTAHACAIPDIQVCGKTGTSQNPHGDDHSVFFAFAPKENPKIAIAVYVENAGWGASYAAPIASLMIEKYINRSIRPERIPIEERMIKANLIEKYLANHPVLAKPLPASKDSLPKPEDVPDDAPEGLLNDGAKIGQSNRHENN